MKAILGYILSGLGIVTLAFSQDKIKNSLSIKFLSSLSSSVFLAIGGILVVAGVVVLIMSNNSPKNSTVKQSKEEVPIYEGEGKHRKIIGYRKN